MVRKLSSIPISSKKDLHSKRMKDYNTYNKLVKETTLSKPGYYREKHTELFQRAITDILKLERNPKRIPEMLKLNLNAKTLRALGVSIKSLAALEYKFTIPELIKLGYKPKDIRACCDLKHMVQNFSLKGLAEIYTFDELETVYPVDVLVKFFGAKKFVDKYGFNKAYPLMVSIADLKKEYTLAKIRTMLYNYKVRDYIKYSQNDRVKMTNEWVSMMLRNW